MQQKQILKKKKKTGVDTSRYTKQVDLASLKSNVDKLSTDKFKNVSITLNNLQSRFDKLNVDKLVPVPNNLSRLTDVVN